MEPIEVNDSNQLKIRKKYYSQGVNCKPFKFAIRDHVRINRDKGVFAKGYVQRWSEEHFVIESFLCRTPNVYVLRDLSGETLQGVFYEEQLQKVRAPDIFPISRIVRKSGKRALVEWRGWFEKFNSWIPLSDLQKIYMKYFYVYLPSNTDVLHDNTASRYGTKLVKELTLSSDWECCLKEIHYPRSWNTLDRDEGNFYIHHLNQNTWETKTLPPGHYESNQQVIDAMNKVLRNIL